MPQDLQNTFEVQDHAYLLLMTTDEKPEYMVLHRPSVFTVPLGQTSIYNGSTYMFVGDLVDHQIASVNWPEDALAPTTPVVAPTFTSLATAFAQDRELETVGPYSVSDPDTEVTTTRKMMYLPPKYAAIALAALAQDIPLTPRVAWERIGGDILNQGQAAVQAYCPLLDYLKIGCTQTNSSGNLATVFKKELTFPYPDSKLTRHRMNLVRRDLPGAFSLPTTSIPGTPEVIGAINSLTEEQRRSREDAERRHHLGSNKTLRGHYGAALDTLLRITRAPSETSLPPLYTAVAQASKNNLRAVVQQHLDEAANLLGWSAHTPIATPELCRRINQANYAHYDLDELTEGIQPFICGFRTVQNQSYLSSKLAAYDTLMNGESAARLTDIYNLQEIEKINLPTTMLQTLVNSMSFQIMLVALLGQDHHLTVEHMAALRVIERKASEWEAQCDSDTPACIIRYHQIRISSYMNEQLKTNIRVAVPNLEDLALKIQFREPWKPALPAKYRASAPKGIPKGNTGSPSSPPTVRDSVPSQHVRVLNPNYQAKFEVFKSSGKSIKSVREWAKEPGNEIPKNSKDTEHCLSYHCLGFCWDNCTRTEDHRKHSAEEDATIYSYCVEAFKPRET